ANRAPCVRAPESAAYRSPGRTAVDARLTPTTSPGASAAPTSPQIRLSATGRTSRGRESTVSEVINSLSSGQECPSLSSPIQRGPRRSRALRRHPVTFERGPHHVVEHRTRVAAARPASGGVVEYDVGQEARIACRREPDERHGVLPFHVLPGLGVDAPRRTGLAGGAITGDFGVRCRSARAGHTLHHRGDGACRTLGDDPM